MNTEQLIKDLWIKQDVWSLVKYFFDVELTPEQEDIVREVAYNDHKRVVICCMTRYGKSFSVSIGVLLWILRNPGKKVGIIAPTNEKTAIIRNHIANFVSKSDLFMGLLDIDRKGHDRIRKEVSKRRMTWKNGVEMRTLSAEGEGEQLMGWGFNLVVCDEMCDIKYEVHRSKITRMLGEDPRSAFVGIGNPWHRDNQFWQAWINLTWKKIHIEYAAALKEGRITQEFIDEQKSQLTDREFQILYKAEFPDTAEDALIDWKWIDKAIGRQVTHTKTEVIAGADIAEQGNDLSVITVGIRSKDIGNYTLQHVYSWGKLDLMPTVGKIVELIEKHSITQITVDSSGVGSGVYSRLTELRDEGKIKCRVIAYKGGQSATTDAGKEKFLNIKAEQYWRLRDMFEHGKVSIIRERLLIDQLSKMKWEFTSARKIKICDPGTKQGDTSEEKSPDFSDSLMLLCSETGPTPLVFMSLTKK